MLYDIILIGAVHSVFFYIVGFYMGRRSINKDLEKFKGVVK